MGWKYVMIEVTLGEHLNPADGTKMLFPVIFPDKLTHDMMVGGMMAVLSAHGLKHATAVSAGSIEHIAVDGLGGNSVTLDISSNPEDIRTIQQYSYRHGVKS